MLKRPWEAIDHELADMMSSYWANFAKSGNPNAKGLPKWKAFNSKKAPTLLIDTVTRSQTLPDRARMLFWSRL